MEVSPVVALVYFVAGPLGIVHLRLEYGILYQDPASLVYPIASAWGTICWVLAARYFRRFVAG